MEKKIISKVTESKDGQRRITVPKKDKSIMKEDFVEIKKVLLK